MNNVQCTTSSGDGWRISYTHKGNHFDVQIISWIFVIENGGFNGPEMQTYAFASSIDNHPKYVNVSTLEDVEVYRVNDGGGCLVDVDHLEQVVRPEIN